MHCQIKIKLQDLNDYLKCPLCKGYFVDASTITECLHSFCKSCLVRYIKRNDSCPLCGLEIIYEKIGNFVKRDTNLQCIVYKLVPNLYKREMYRRRDYFTNNPRGIKYKSRMSNLLDKEALGESNDEEYLLVERKYDDISLVLEYDEEMSNLNERMNNEDKKKYLLCPARCPIRIIKKLLIKKFDLENEKMIDVIFDDKLLSDDLTLIDINYLFALIPKLGPIRLKFRIKTTQSTDQVKFKQIENKIDAQKTLSIDLKPTPPPTPSLIPQQFKTAQNENSQPTHSIKEAFPQQQQQHLNQAQYIYQAYGQYFNMDYYNYMRRLNEYQQAQQYYSNQAQHQHQQEQQNSAHVDSLKETQKKILESAFLIDQ